MIEEILPAKVAAVEYLHDPADALLFPAEEALVARAVPKRRAEFTTGRHCARRALASIGVAPAPILPGVRGAPQWPAGIVGSITHCAGYRAAAVAEHRHLDGVGIDAEPHAPLPSGVLATIALPTELEHLTRLATAAPAVHWDRLLFRAKETVYKVWSPRTGQWLGFEAAEITFDPEHGGFSARLIGAGLAGIAGAEWTSFTGRWLVRAGLALTAIAVATR